MQVSYQRLHNMNPIQARRMIIETYQRCASISATAHQIGTSRQVVRKWIRRYEAEGEKGLMDRSRRPHISPRKTPSKIERLVRKLRSKTGYGRRRLAWILRRDYNICISEDTVRHILRRLGVKSKGKPRRKFYPAHWAWEVKQPFSLAQVDTKHILDFGALGSKRWDHLRKHHLPIYQWTFFLPNTNATRSCWDPDLLSEGQKEGKRPTPVRSSVERAQGRWRDSKKPSTAPGTLCWQGYPWDVRGITVV